MFPQPKVLRALEEFEEVGFGDQVLHVCRVAKLTEMGRICPMPTLNWIGKDKVVNHHLDVPFRVLDHQYGFDNGTQSNKKTGTGNMIIKGDNLEALKSLLPKYEGKVKCIYIDPPYNTGNEGWVYNDNVNDPKIKKWLGEVVGKEGEDLSRHDKWLCMMYPRLKLLNKLLRKDGAMVISLSHHELHHLILLCQEIFGDRQIVTVTTQASGGKPSGGFNYQHEYLVFVVPYSFTPNALQFSGGKSRSPFEGLTLATFTKEQRPNQAYPIYVNEKTGAFVSCGKSLQERIRSGLYTKDAKDFEYDFKEAPEGTVAIWPITSKGKDCVWRLIPERLNRDWEKGYIKISLNKSKKSLNKYSIQYLPIGVINKIESKSLQVIGNEEPHPTLILGENETVGGQIPTIWGDREFYTVKGTTVVNEIFGTKIFSYPKPLELVTEVLRGISSSNDIVLDSFAGSGTTAHAVLNLNKQDGGSRKFILVELGDYADTITAERNKRVINGYGEDKNAVEGTGGAFDFYELGAPLFLSADQLNEDIGVAKIREYIWYTETQIVMPENTTNNPYLLGTNNDTDYYFYYERDKVTTLDLDFIASLPQKAEGYIIYADRCTLSESYMTKHNITFKKIPRDITRI